MDVKRIISVSELTGYLKDIVENDSRLSNLWLRGEVSNVRLPASGHLYFTLKDESALVRCVMFKGSSSLLNFCLEDGMNIIARGNLGIYEKNGIYQLYVKEVQLYGTGSLYQALEQLKKKLRQEGLFDSIHKKRLPYCPKKIGIVTSKSGAALRDIINVITRRCSGVKIYVVPVQVQGELAPHEIASAIKCLNDNYKPEVIIVTRGGGSLEELWAFNSEEVARAIFKSKIPVVSAVGHETDFTISDLVADLRAPTPSAAAELVVPSISDLEEMLNSLIMRLRTAVISTFKEREERIGYLVKRFGGAVKTIIEKKEERLRASVRTLNSLSPLNVLERGYAVCMREEGGIVKDSRDVEIGESVKVLLARGKLQCNVDGKEECGK